MNLTGSLHQQIVAPTAVAATTALTDAPVTRCGFSEQVRQTTSSKWKCVQRAKSCVGKCCGTGRNKTQLPEEDMTFREYYLLSSRTSFGEAHSRLARWRPLSLQQYGTRARALKTVLCSTAASNTAVNAVPHSWTVGMRDKGWTRTA